MSASARETAPAKLNLVLEVGAAKPSGLHEVCSLMASIDLADTVVARPRDDAGTTEAATRAPGAGVDAVEVPGVDGPDLTARALAAFRVAAPEAALGPLSVAVEKRIPVAAGLGGGSADAAAVLRVANRLAGDPLGRAELEAVAASLGSDVPSQLDPGHALVTGTGEGVEPVPLPAFAAVLLPQAQGLATAEVFAELDRLGAGRARLDPDRLRRLAAGSVEELAAALENDLQAAALSLRPELAEALAALRDAGALGALVSGSGPTAFGLFERPGEAEAAAAALPDAIVAESREP